MWKCGLFWNYRTHQKKKLGELEFNPGLTRNRVLKVQNLFYMLLFMHVFVGHFNLRICPWSPLNNVYQLYMYVVQYLLHSVLDIHVHFQKISTHVIVCLTMWSLCSWIVMFELHTAWLCNCITYQLLCSAVTFFLSSLSHVSLLGISINLSMIPCKLVISSVLLPIYLTLSVS